MLTSIWDDVKREFSSGNMVTRIIIINIAAFVLVNLVKIIAGIPSGYQDSTFFNDFYEFFCISSDFWEVLTRPWSIFTHMFLHVGFWHILWNMIFMYWFGRIVGDFIGDHRILPIYLLSGLSGAAIYFITANLGVLDAIQGNELPTIHYALGASAGVMGIIMAAATISPDYIMRLILIGDVKLKYIAAVLIFLFLIAISNNDNSGGHFAHLGGVGMGWLFVYQLRNGVDWSEPINSLLSRFSAFFRNLGRRMKGERRKPKVAYKNTEAIKNRRWGKGKGSASSDTENLTYQERLDAILEKIKEKGYEGLSAEEKEFLYNASKK